VGKRSAVATEPPQRELEVARCWEADDRVPGRPAMTAYRRRLRYHQSQWREAHGHPIGTQPMAPRPGAPVRLVGSRLPLDYGRDTGANFLTDGALAAARARTSITEPHQSFDHQRLWADLLSSAALSFNLFGDVAADVTRADRVVHTWWPDAPGTVCDVRFAHSPGRLDPEYLNSLRAFDVAFVLDVGSGERAMVAVDTKYHERNKAEQPKPKNAARNMEVCHRSGAFAPTARRLLESSDLAEMWLEHLLMLSMLQHKSGRWTWGRYVVVHPAGNTDAADAAARYRDLLTDDATYATMTIEALLATRALPPAITKALRTRYLPR
jgi:PD-(D/E)XK nuclease superfamily protein